MTFNNDIMTFDQVVSQMCITNPSDQQPLKFKTTPPSHEIPSTFKVITLGDPYSSSGKSGKVIACVVGIILGAGMISLIGGFGTAGLFNNAGLAQYPQWLVNQINTIPNMYHNVMVGVGYIGGVIAIAISSIALYKILNPEAGEQSIAGMKNRLFPNSEKTLPTGDDVEANTGITPLEGNVLREKTELDKEFMNRMGKRSFKIAEWRKEITDVWNQELHKNKTYIFYAYNEGVKVIGKTLEGKMWVTVSLFTKAADLRRLIEILDMCEGYKRSENTKTPEEIIHDEFKEAETVLEKSDALDEDPNQAVVVPKIVVPAQKERDSQVLNKKEQAFINSAKWTRTYYANGIDEDLLEAWGNQLTTLSTYIFQAYEGRVYDVIGRDQNGKMWFTEESLTEDELKTYAAILGKKYGYTPSENQD